MKRGADKPKAEQPARSGRGFFGPPGAGRSFFADVSTAETARASAAVASGGAPLAATDRAFFAPRLGDLGSVRLHDGPAAAATASALGARAFTVGNAIGFAAGHGPASPGRRRLLAHELTHVTRHDGRGTTDPRDREREAEAAETGALLPAADGGVGATPARLNLSPERATRLTIVVAETGDSASFTLDRDEGAALTASGTAGGLEPGEYRIARRADQEALVITYADGSGLPETSQFYIEIPRSAAIMHRLLQAASDPIPLDVRVGPVAVPAGPGSGSGGGAGSLRDAVAGLPEHVRSFLLGGTAPNDATTDRETLLRIGAKLAELSESELEAYRARTTGITSDWSQFEASVDRYLDEMRQRRAAAGERERLKRQLYGLDAVYAQYRRYVDMLASTAGAASSPMSVGVALGSQPTLNRMREELTAALAPHGFASIDAFAQAIDAFRSAFRDETVLIAREMLDRYEHILNEQEARYRRGTGDLHAALAPARTHFREAIRLRDAHAMMPMTPDEMAEQAYWSGQFQAEQASGRAAVGALSDTHPLMGNSDLAQEDLALADASDLGSMMLGYIRDRRADVQATRRNIADDPDLIFELDALLSVAYREQDIRPGSLYRTIIAQHISDAALTRTVINLAIAVFAIAAGIVSGGTGTVAVLAGATALGIGAYQAVEEFRRYETMSSAHGAQLVSEDPSFAWVIVAVVGAGIDLAAFGAALRVARFRTAIASFNAGEAAGDVATLERSLADIPEIEERIRRSVVQAARTEESTRAAWRSVFRPPAVLRAVIVPGAEEFGRLVYAVYLSARRGIAGFERFLLSREAVDLIGDAARLAPEELTALKGGYAAAISNWEEIARRGVALGMSDDEIHAFMRLWNNRGAMTLDQVTAEMAAWRTLQRSGVPFGFRSAEHFEEFRSMAQAELRRALRRTDPRAELFLQGSSVTGIAYTRKVPFDAASDLDVAISSRYLMDQAASSGLEVLRNPRRIGPLTDEAINELGLRRLRDRLSRTLADEAAEGAESAEAATRKINFMLFENERAVRTPLGAAAEATRPTLPLRSASE